MRQTITIDIINDKAIKLLEDLELLELIQLHREKKQEKAPVDWSVKYKGAMKTNGIAAVDNQLNELRSSRE